MTSIYVTHQFNNGKPSFNSQNSITVGNYGDTIKKILFHIKVGEAPEGYKFKEKWWQNLFKRVTLTIGNQVICQSNSEIPMNDTTVEPIVISDIFSSQCIRLISLQYYEVVLNITFGSIEDCVEPAHTNSTIPIVAPDLEVTSSILFDNLDYDSRKELVTNRYEDIVEKTKTLTYKNGIATLSF